MYLVFGALAALIAATSLVLFLSPKRAHDAQAGIYTCSMHPTIQSEMAGSCPICGMTLTRVSPTQTSRGTIVVDAARQRLGGVRTAAASVQSLSHTVVGSGRVTYDESALSDVVVRVPGYVAAPHVDSIGQEVRENAPLLTLQSPELYEAQREFLAEHDHSDRAAREKLLLLGMSETRIDSLMTAGHPQPSFEVLSPISGVVIVKELVAGARVLRGQRVFRIAPTHKLWVEADLDDSVLAALRVGQAAEITTERLPRAAFKAQVTYIYSGRETAGRTGGVRLSVDNSSSALRHGMHVTLKLQTEGSPRLQVPASAVLYAGTRRLVFVSDGNERFTPQEVELGRQTAGMVEVVRGLQPGEMVAVSGAFMLAAEARIATNTALFDRASTDQAGHANAGMQPGVAPAPAAAVPGK
ncbi:MAG TPA: efflux RND transporter periplasmic adaptor subunit [Polyangiales bacterium]|nr:efflux RND transporter periplasmic adaptor subunit [Polyangiales bacterium]